MENNINEIVQYDNKLNKTQFNDFTAIDFNFLMTLCAKLKNKGTSEIKLDFLEIKKATGYSTKNTNDRFMSDLARMNRKLLDAKFEIEDDRILEMFVLFTNFRIDKVNHTLSVSINEKYTYLLNELTSQFTKFELQTFNNLKSKYSKTLYRLLMQFRKTGMLIITKKNLEAVLCVPKSYTTNDLLRKVIEPAIEEIAPYLEDINMDTIRSKKRGNPVVAFRFTFKKSYKKQVEKIIEPRSEEKSYFNNLLEH